MHFRSKFGDSSMHGWWVMGRTSSKWGKIWLSSWIWPWRSRSIIPKNNRHLNQGLLHLCSKFGDSSLNEWWVIVRTSPWLTHTHTDTRTHGHTDTQTQATTIPEGQNWPRVKSPENSSEAETWFWWNSNLICRWLGALLTPPFKCFCPTEGQILHKHDKNQQGSRHSMFDCVYQIWILYILFKAMNAYKWLWPIFGCKVGESVQIGMKLELGVWHHPLDVYAKFQTDISQHVQKSPENFRWLRALVTPHFKCFCPPEGQKLSNHDENK